jgi:predicted metalloprotease with PDZ domain
MRYRLSLPEPHTHLFHVEVEIERPAGAVELVFPVWTPGSYLVREFARHVEQVSAADGGGRALPLERLDKHRFRVDAGDAARAVLRYRVYANELTVRTAHLDGTHAYLNPAAVLPFVRGRAGEPHVLAVDAPAGWSVATALEGGPTEFTARDYDDLADSPVEIGTHRTLRFEALGVPHELALWGRGNLDEAAFVADARRIVERVGGLMGGLPYRRYLFVVHLADKRRGGLEHAASTTLHVARSGFFPRKAYEETLGLLAHEFFHVWNVKRLRPAAFVPFDYGREQYTRLLWWFEGATSYYEQLILARAGIQPPRRWLEALGQALTTLERSPGARKMSVEESSFLAWVKLYRPDENTSNSTISYYLKGELVAFALDLALRRAGRSLDELLRTLYARHAEGGVPEDGVERVAAELLGEAPARGFFDRFVRGTDPLELDLDLVGLRLRRRAAGGLEDKGGTPGKSEDGKPPAGWLGIELAGGPKLAVASVREGSPAERAGLYAGDELVAEDGFRLERGARWDRLSERGPGGRLRLTVFRRDELLDVEVALGTLPEDTVWLEPVAAPTPAQRAAFEAWAAAPWPWPSP